VGLFKAQFKRGWWTKSSTSKPMLKVLFVFETETESKKQFNGFPLFHNITYEASTMWKMKELFAALRSGSKSAIDFDDKGDVTRIGRAVPGKAYLLVRTQMGTYKGQPKVEVGTLSPLPGGEDEMDEGGFEDDTEMATDFNEAAASVPEDSAGDSGAAEEAAAQGDPWSADASDGQDEPPF
jgi:hypothetical protein